VASVIIKSDLSIAFLLLARTNPDNIIYGNLFACSLA
jgi:hypothetical protein